MNERIDPRTEPGNPAYNPAAVSTPASRAMTTTEKRDYCSNCQDSTMHTTIPGKNFLPGSRVCHDCMHSTPLGDDSVMRRVSSSMAGRRDRKVVAELTPPKLEFMPLEHNLEVEHHQAMRAKVPGGWLLVMGDSQPLYIPDPDNTWHSSIHPGGKQGAG